jgi:serine O-acetyltransferase
MTLKQLIQSDIEAWARVWKSKPSPAFVYHYCGLRATLLYRVSHALWKSRVPLLPGMLFRLNITLHGFDVPPSTPIGPGLYVPHPVGTVLSAERIGANVTLISSITVGMRGEGEFPVLEDGVFVGAGARILGRVTVGANAKIGANAVVLSDVPADATAVGVPARVLTPRVEKGALC